METFRYKNKQNKLFSHFSELKHQRTQSHDHFKQNNTVVLPSFRYNTQLCLNKQSMENQSNQTAKINITQKYNKATHQQKNSKDFYQFTLREKKIRKNNILTERETHELYSFSLKKTTKIDQTMKEKNKCFYLTLRKNNQKLNCSYRNTFQNTLRYNLATKNQFRLSEEQSIKIKMESKSRKKIVFHNQNKFKQSKTNTSSEELFLKQNNLFNIQIESRKCLDGIFPIFRNGATLASVSSQIYLFGGVNSRLADTYHFHEYLKDEKLWVSVKNREQSPHSVLSFHSVQHFKNSLIFIGGTIIGSSSVEKSFNSDINIYEIQKEQWTKIKWNVCIRSHASTIYGNMLVVYGGINEKQTFSNKLYFLPLNGNNLGQTNPNSYNLGSDTEGIAYHSLLNTFQIDSAYKCKIKIDGVICYGGKYSDGKLNQHVNIFRFNETKQSAQRQNTIKGWQTVQTYGVKPEPRYCHTMDLIYKKCICFVIGGINQEQEPLNDSWILDLINLTWTKVLFDSKYPIIEKGIFSHTTAVLNSEIYVFGGMNGDNKLVNEFWSVDFSVSRAVKRQQELKKSRLCFASTKKITRQYSKFKSISQLP